MRTLAVTAALLWVMTPTAQAGQIYKWVDAQGVTHFDAQPPAGKAATAVDTVKTVTPPPPAAPKAAAGGAAQQKALDNQVKRQVAEQEDKIEKFCTGARTNLAQLKNNPRIRQEVDGELKRLNEDERQQKITETQQMIDEHCS